MRDFGFLSQEGLDESDKQSFKFLVIKEVFSSSIGAVVVSDEKGGEQQLISKWFGEFGLRNSAEEVSVVLLTDSELAVSSMVANIQGYQFLLHWACTVGLCGVWCVGWVGGFPSLVIVFATLA